MKTFSTDKNIMNYAAHTHRRLGTTSRWTKGTSSVTRFQNAVVKCPFGNQARLGRAVQTQTTTHTHKLTHSIYKQILLLVFLQDVFLILLLLSQNVNLMVQTPHLFQLIHVFCLCVRVSVCVCVCLYVSVCVCVCVCVDVHLTSHSCFIYITIQYLTIAISPLQEHIPLYANT